MEGQHPQRAPLHLVQGIPSTFNERDHSSLRDLPKPTTQLKNAGKPKVDSKQETSINPWATVCPELYGIIIPIKQSTDVSMYMWVYG